MEFKNIQNKVSKEFKERLKGYEKEIKTQEGLNKVVGYPLNKRESYKGTFEEQQKKCLIALKKKLDKEFENKISFIKSVEESKDFCGEFIITLEWKKSHMWGSNPRAYTNYGFEGESIGGCGYCKTSTATAQALNNYKPILKLLYAKEEERLKEIVKSTLSQEDKDKFLERRGFIGYGSGYGKMPSFEGGVGVSSHESILENLGLKMRCITDTSQTNVYLITKI